MSLSATKPTTKPLFLLIPGAWHLSSCYEALQSRLTAAGYPSQTIALTSASPNVPPVPDISADVDAIRRTMTSILDDDDTNDSNNEGRDLILVMHSYGGIPGGEASKGFSKREREARGMKGGIVKLVYLAAFAPEVGQSLLNARDPLAASDWLDFKENGHVLAKDPRYIFYNDIAPSIAADISKIHVVPHSAVTFTIPVTYAAWKHIPTMYVICTADNCTENVLQERMGAAVVAAAVQQLGMNEEEQVVIRLRSGHLPFLSMPGEVARILRRAAGERGDAVRLRYEYLGDDDEEVGS